MLIIYRNEGESFFLNEETRVLVCKIEGHRVKIGIEAPQSVRVRRDEHPPGVAPPDYRAAAKAWRDACTMLASGDYVTTDVVAALNAAEAMFNGE